MGLGFRVCLRVLGFRVLSKMVLSFYVVLFQPRALNLNFHKLLAFGLELFVLTILLNFQFSQVVLF